MNHHVQGHAEVRRAKLGLRIFDLARQRNVRAGAAGIRGEIHEPDGQVLLIAWRAAARLHGFKQDPAFGLKAEHQPLRGRDAREHIGDQSNPGRQFSDAARHVLRLYAGFGTGFKADLVGVTFFGYDTGRTGPDP